MYLPSMLFGGSSLLHILASHPRVVAVFGLGVLMSSVLQTPLGLRDLPGTAAYVRHLDHDPATQRAVPAAVIEDARAATLRVRQQSSASELGEIVAETLRDCGDGCVGLTSAAVLKDRTLLEQVLFVGELNKRHTQRHTRGQSQ